MTDRIDAIAAAIARVERESQARDQTLESRIVELEHHADWLENRVGQLFFLEFLALAYVIAEQWFGKSIFTLIAVFLAALALAMLVVEGWKTPASGDGC
jgi:Flp pilus assembly protein TadB